MKKTLDIKKLILLNMPYILLGLFATNFGEAWRMAQGADASEKFLSLIAVLPGALQSFWPSLHPLDLLVGLCCGVGLRLAVYLKSKNAKKYRHGLEYGSARWLDENELKLFCDKKASLAYCPSSNMFLADGVTNIKEMVKNGVTIGVGTDGACSNNRISVFEEMRMASLLQKADKLDALTIDSDVAFDFGTKNGGKILDLPIGEIREGCRADLVGLDLNDFSMQPMFDNYEQLLPNIVYSMQPTAIRKVVVNGRTTVDRGHMDTLSEEMVTERVKKLMKKFQSV